MCKQNLQGILLAILLCTVIQSCVDKDYDWDALDKQAVMNIPPVPVGSIDTAWFKSNLTTVVVPDYPGVFAMEFVVKELFTDDVVSKFFFDGARTATLEGQLSIAITHLNDDARILMLMNILNVDDEVIDAVMIDSKEARNKREGQPFVLEIDSEYMRHMGPASGVKITFILDGLTEVGLDRDDYLALTGLVLKTGGMQIDL